MAYQIETNLNPHVIPEAYTSTQSGILINDPFDSFYRTHKKVMWDLSSVRFDQIDKSRLTDQQVAGAKAAMKVESHNPVYTQRLLEMFRQDHAMSAFLQIWGYEEMHHYIVLRTYLEACGALDNTQLSQELVQVRQGQWGDYESKFTVAQSVMYTSLQEKNNCQVLLQSCREYRRTCIKKHLSRSCPG